MRLCSWKNRKISHIADPLSSCCASPPETLGWKTALNQLEIWFTRDDLTVRMWGVPFAGSQRRSRCWGRGQPFGSHLLRTVGKSPIRA